MLLFLSLFITSKTLKGALEVIIRSQIATVFNRILFPNLIIFGNFWQLLATFGNFVNLGESCQKLLRTPPYTYNRRGLKPLIVLLALLSVFNIMSFSSADVKTLLNIFSINPDQSYISEETRYPVKFNSKKVK